MLLLPNRWWIVFLNWQGMKISYHNPNFGFSDEEAALRKAHKLNRRNEQTRYEVRYGVAIQGYYFNRDAPGE